MENAVAQGAAAGLTAVTATGAPAYLGLMVAAQKGGALATAWRSAGVAAIALAQAGFARSVRVITDPVTVRRAADEHDGRTVVTEWSERIGNRGEVWPAPNQASYLFKTP